MMRNIQKGLESNIWQKSAHNFVFAVESKAVLKHKAQKNEVVCEGREAVLKDFKKQVWPIPDKENQYFWRSYMKVPRNKYWNSMERKCF